MGFAIGRPRMAATVVDACGLPPGAKCLVAFFFAVTIQNCFPASNPARQERGNVAKKTGCATKIFEKEVSKRTQRAIQRFNDSLFRLFPFSLGNDYTLLTQPDAVHMVR
jgi:hypothetical protein